MATFTANPSTARFHGDVRCNGRNHSDIGTWGTCDGCGDLVIKTHKGHLANVVIGGSDEHRGERFQCWNLHQCNPKLAALRGVREAEELLRGLFPKGVEVEVYKGRKVPVGTVGEVRWVGEGYTEGSKRLGLAVEGQDKLVYVDGSNCRVAAEALAAAQATVDAYQAMQTERDDRLKALEAELAAMEEDRDNGPLSRLIFEARKTEGALKALWAEDGALTLHVARHQEILAEIAAIKTERGY